LAVCILYAIWAWCCCRGWVYWYLHDINKYSLSKKNHNGQNTNTHI
jgi:hypothetical protein